LKYPKYAVATQEDMLKLHPTVVEITIATLGVVTRKDDQEGASSVNLVVEIYLVKRR
jgi:hypothetical protein